MEHFVSFELTDADIESLRNLGWGHGRSDLVCQTIVRDYIRRNQAKAARAAARRRLDPASRARNAGL